MANYTKTTISISIKVADKLRILSAVNRRSSSAQADLIIAEYCKKEFKKLEGKPLDPASK